MSEKVTYDITTNAFSTGEYTPPTIDIPSIKSFKSQDLRTATAGFLVPTDYIILKLQEYEALNLETSALLTKYAAELAYRQSVRTWNDTQEAAIAAATTVEELSAIDVTSGPQS